MKLGVIIPTHNPHPGRLVRTLQGLRAQTLSTAHWECILVDNASSAEFLAPHLSFSNLRVVRESQLGLSHARRRGLRESTAEICIFADDDNVLAPDYLENALRIATGYPHIGAFGGRSVPEFEVQPAEWVFEFFTLLALRDPGQQAIITSAQTPLRTYPLSAPIGAGMVLRREAAKVWLDAPPGNLTDRRGHELTSGGDNDIVLTLFAAGWDVAYFPELKLTHIIPKSRLQPAYLARLNRGIQKSWMQVLRHHAINPWPSISNWSVMPRKLKAWFTYRAWSGDAAYIRWQGACGHFEGRAA